MSARLRQGFGGHGLLGHRPDATLVAALLAVVVFGGLGLLATPLADLPPLPSSFGNGELIGWSVLGLATGGFVFGRRDPYPPVVAGGLVGSAALLGADAWACAFIGGVAAFGGLRRRRGMGPGRVAAGAFGGWALVGVVTAAASLGGPSIGRSLTVTLGEVVALWASLALLLPAAESLGSRAVLPAAQAFDVGHVVRHRLEPQTVLAALSVVAALGYDAIGAPAALIVLLPASTARLGFAMHDDGRRAVKQTLAAMTVLPEWVGIVDVGHSARVRAVVEQCSIELGHESRLRRDIVDAASLHELGHLDGGVVNGDQGRVARSGAAVLEQADSPQRVVAIVAATDPDRPVSHPDPVIENAAGLITKACRLDSEHRLLDVEDAVARVLTARSAVGLR